MEMCGLVVYPSISLDTNVKIVLFHSQNQIILLTDFSRTNLLLANLVTKIVNIHTDTSSFSSDL